MNDHFLYQAKPELDKEFANQLYNRIKVYEPDPQSIHKTTIWWIKRAAFAIALLVTIILIFSPNSWSTLQALARDLRQGLTPSSKLIGNIIVVDLPSDSTAQPLQEPSVSVSDIPHVYILVNNIEEKTGLEFEIPIGAPKGCALNSEALAWPDDEIPSSHITWTCSNNAGEGKIHLFVTDAPMITKLPIDSYDVVYVNENPVLIIRGIWTSQTETSEERRWSLSDEMIRLTWDDGNYLYQMWSPGAFVEEKVLLEMIESVYK